MDYYPVTPPRKDHTIVKVLIAGAGCLSLVIGIGAFLVGKFYFSVREPTRTIEEHIHAINEGNYEVAYAQFTEDFRRNTSYREFREQMEEFSSLLPSQSSSLPDVKIVNDKASVEGTLTGRDGAIFPVQYELVKEKGVWKISTYRWTSPGDRIKV
jgi:hypothetical protein